MKCSLNVQITKKKTSLKHKKKFVSWAAVVFFNKMRVGVMMFQFFYGIKLLRNVQKNEHNVSFIGETGNS